MREAGDGADFLPVHLFSTGLPHPPLEFQGGVSCAVGICSVPFMPGVCKQIIRASRSMQTDILAPRSSTKTSSSSLHVAFSAFWVCPRALFNGGLSTDPCYGKMLSRTSVITKIHG